jgi:hypothetical protein
VTALRPRPRHAAALLLAAALLALGALWSSPTPAYACSCVTDSEPELIRNAGVIFTGTVTGDRSLGSTRTYTFAVDRVYRGQVLTTQTVKTPSRSPACGLELSTAGPHLVLGYLENGVLWANSCGGTRAGTAPASLGVGEVPLPYPASPPTDPATEEDPRNGRWVPLVAFILALTTAAVVGLSLVRRRPG